MEPEVLWKRYSAIWSMDADRRHEELLVCVADDVTYCDPNGLIEGRLALSDYMGTFQRAVPGGQFEIHWVLRHHDRSLAHWALQRPDGNVLQRGTSFATVTMEDRLRDISGFFHAADTSTLA
jgi:SnoaL-like domain